MQLWNKAARDAVRKTPLYKSTWDTWNAVIDLEDGRNHSFQLCGRESIGHTMKLIRDCCPCSFPEWQAYYLNSGLEGQSEEKHLNPFASDAMRKSERQMILRSHGRSMEQLQHLAKVFQGALYKRQEISLSDEEALNYVFIRAVDETWIGYQRELAAEHELTLFCKRNGLSLRPASDRDDIKHGCDLEIFKGNTLVCGIQVKGSAFNRNYESSYSRYVRQSMSRYTRLYHAPVFFACVNKHLGLDRARELESYILSEVGRLSTRPSPEHDHDLSFEQRRYFSKSKVRDAEGSLLVMYHGSPSKFRSFDPYKIGMANGTGNGAGFNFTESHDFAERYAKKVSCGKGYVYACYLDIHNPLTSDRISLSRKQVEKIIVSSLNPFWNADPVPAFLQKDPEGYVKSLREKAMTDRGSQMFRSDVSVLEVISETIKEDFFHDPNCYDCMEDIMERYYETKEGRKLLDSSYDRESEEYLISDETVFAEKILKLPYRVAEEDLHYDGYISRDNNGKMIAVAMHPEQIKSVSNLTPLRSSQDLFDREAPDIEEIENERKLEDDLSAASSLKEERDAVRERTILSSDEKEI